MLGNQKIELRSPELEDVEFLFGLENDRQYWHLSHTLLPFSRFDIEQYILLAEKDIFSSGQARFMIDYIEEGEKKTVGCIDLFEVQAKHRRAGVGIMIVEEERKKGIATQALEVLIRYAKELLNFHQLYCHIGIHNEDSLSLFESKGFVRAGIRKEWNLQNGQWEDEVFLQLILD